MMSARSVVIDVFREKISGFHMFII